LSTNHTHTPNCFSSQTNNQAEGDKCVHFVPLPGSHQKMSDVAAVASSGCGNEVGIEVDEAHHNKMKVTSPETASNSNGGTTKSKGRGIFSTHRLATRSKKFYPKFRTKETTNEEEEVDDSNHNKTILEKAKAAVSLSGSKKETKTKMVMIPPVEEEEEEDDDDDDRGGGGGGTSSDDEFGVDEYDDEYDDDYDDYEEEASEDDRVDHRSRRSRRKRTRTRRRRPTPATATATAINTMMFYKLSFRLVTLWFFTGLAIFVLVLLTSNDDRYGGGMGIGMMMMMTSTDVSRSSNNQNDNQKKPPRLQFDSSTGNTFRIMQITDIHLGEAESTAWGPEQDRKTFKLLDEMLSTLEPNVDLIVLGGDQVTANDCLHNCTDYVRILGDFLSKYGIPWVSVIGNHDDLMYEVPPEENPSPQEQEQEQDQFSAGSSGGNATTNYNSNSTQQQPLPQQQQQQRHNYTRDDILKIDSSFDLSLTQIGPRDVRGSSNYFINVYSDDRGDQDDKIPPAMQIYLFDSGGGTIEEEIDDSQINWFQQVQRQQRRMYEYGRKKRIPAVPAVAFEHIPTRQYVQASHCIGSHDDGIEYVNPDAGIIDALLNASAESSSSGNEMDGFNRFLFVGVGHNHGNDYCCQYSRRPQSRRRSRQLRQTQIEDPIQHQQDENMNTTATSNRSTSIMNTTTTTTKMPPPKADSTQSISRLTTTTTSTRDGPEEDEKSSSSSMITLCYGRHSGFGGYGTWQRGVRIYEIKLSSSSEESSTAGSDDGDGDGEAATRTTTTTTAKWRSWVRLESGAYVDYFDWR